MDALTTEAIIAPKIELTRVTLGYEAVVKVIYLGETPYENNGCVFEDMVEETPKKQIKLWILSLFVVMFYHSRSRLVDTTLK